MTTTARLGIRDALATLVGTATGLTPYLNLDFALSDETLPAVAITSGPDEIDDEAGTHLSGAYEGTTARFDVRVLVAGGSDPEAVADGYELAIRTAVKSDPTLSDKATHTRYLGGDWDFDLGDCAVRRLAFQATFIS